MKSFIDLFLYKLDQLGAAGRLGIVLTTAAVIAGALLIQPMQSELRVLLENNASLAASLEDELTGRQDQDTGGKDTAEANPFENQRKKADKAAMPQSLEDALGPLFRAATMHRLDVDRGDYTLMTERGAGGALRYQVSLPLAGRYQDLRAFLATGLNENAWLTLDHLRLNRSAIEDAELTATFRFSVGQGPFSGSQQRFPALAQASQANLFARQSWEPPPPPPPPAQPPAPPEPPAFPFEYRGQWQEKGKTVFFFGNEQQSWPVRENDVIEKAWRLDQVSNKELTFMYLPLNKPKTMRISP